MVKVSQLVIVKCMKLKLVNTDQLNNNECEGCNTVIKINKFIVSFGNNMHVGQQMLTDKKHHVLLFYRIIGAQYVHTGNVINFKQNI